MGQSTRFYGQLADGFFRTIGCGVVVREKAHSVVIQTAPYHVLNFKKLEFICHFRVGSLEFFVSLFRCLLAIGQFALLEEFQGVAICSLDAAGAVVLYGKQEK
ncbi:MAG: hypothetical protein ABSD72_03035 [Terracidiphilus sp.]